MFVQWLQLDNRFKNALTNNLKLQWQKESKPSVTYLIYRWIIALIFLITIILSIIDLKNVDASNEYRAKWLIYLTNWGYTMCTFQALLAAILLSISLVNFNKQPRLITAYKTYWAANTIATVIGFGITIIYWSLIYDGKYLALLLHCVHYWTICVQMLMCLTILL